MHDIHIAQDDNYILGIDRMKSDYWLELVERSTGHAYILICDKKESAVETGKGLAKLGLSNVLDKLKTWGVQPTPMYKTK